MSVSTQDTKSTYDPRTVFNVPNQLTSIRLVLAIVLFGLIAYEQYLAGMWVFIVAAGTDWIDGFYARRYNQVTTLGESSTRLSIRSSSAARSFSWRRRPTPA